MSHGLSQTNQRPWPRSRLASWFKKSFPTESFMIKTPNAMAPAADQPKATETEPQRFERILLRPQFKPLKAVFDNLGIAVPLMQGAIITTNSYPMFLGKVG